MAIAQPMKRIMIKTATAAFGHILKAVTKEVAEITSIPPLRKSRDCLDARLFAARLEVNGFAAPDRLKGLALSLLYALELVGIHGDINQSSTY